MLRWREQIAETIREGEQSGEFAPALSPEDIADVLSGVLDGMALQVFAMDSDVSGAEVCERVITVAKRLLLPTDTSS